MKYLHDGEADLDYEQDDERGGQAHTTTPGLDHPETKSTGSHDRDSANEPGFAAAVFVGNRAKKGCRHSEHGAGGRGDVADQCLPLDRVAYHCVAEIRIEDVDDHHDVVGITGTLAKGPAVVAQRGSGRRTCQRNGTAQSVRPRWIRAAGTSIPCRWHSSAGHQ